MTLTALPLSLAAGLLALDALGETINVMTLGGLAIAVGSLVDDAIIDVENVFRRLKQNALSPGAAAAASCRCIFDASNEIRPAMVFATIIIGLVFVPLMFLEGIEGRFFRPLGIAFVVSLLASLVVALTVTPALCRFLLHAAGTERARGARRLPGARLKRVYEPACSASRCAGESSCSAPRAAATALTVWLGATFGTSFLPEFNEGTFTVGLFAPPGTSLRASDRMASAIETQLLEIEGVRSVTRRTGRAERDEHAEPVSNSEIDDHGASRASARRRSGRRSRRARAGPGHHDQRRPADRAPPQPHPLGHARGHRDQRLRQRPRPCCASIAAEIEGSSSPGRARATWRPTAR